MKVITGQLVVCPFGYMCAVQGGRILGCSGAHDGGSPGGHCPETPRESSDSSEGVCVCTCSEGVCVRVCVHAYVCLCMYQCVHVQYVSVGLNVLLSVEASLPVPPPFPPSPGLRTLPPSPPSTSSCLPPLQSFLSDHSSSLTPSHCVFAWLCYVSISRLGQLPSSLFTHRDYLDTKQPLRLLSKVRTVLGAA